VTLEYEGTNGSRKMMGIEIHKGWRRNKPAGDLPLPSSLPGGSLRCVVQVRGMPSGGGASGFPCGCSELDDGGVNRLREPWKSTTARVMLVWDCVVQGADCVVPVSSLRIDTDQGARLHPSRVLGRASTRS
jgi:hypothetical protein